MALHIPNPSSAHYKAAMSIVRPSLFPRYELCKLDLMHCACLYSPGHFRNLRSQWLGTRDLKNINPYLRIHQEQYWWQCNWHNPQELTQDRRHLRWEWQLLLQSRSLESWKSDMRESYWRFSTWNLQQHHKIETRQSNRHRNRSAARGMARMQQYYDMLALSTTGSWRRLTTWNHRHAQHLPYRTWSSKQVARREFHVWDVSI